MRRRVVRHTITGTPVYNKAPRRKIRPPQVDWDILVGMLLILAWAAFAVSAINANVAMHP